MARRTLRASSVGIVNIKKALKRKKCSQTSLSIKVGCSRQTIWSLLHGNAIDCDVFMQACTELKLVWEEISEPELPDSDDSDHSGVEALVKQARERGSKDIEKRCGWMKVLDMSQPIGLGAIYTEVNILEKITGKTRRELDELTQGYAPENFDRFLLGKVRERRVAGLEAVQAKKQLMILGRPGAGKTTFLKRLATLCDRGEFLPEQVPVFVSLKEFAETSHQPGLLNFIAHYFLRSESTQDMTKEQVQEILKQGRGLVLLDGLDEVLEKDHDRVLQEIREFDRHYDESHIIITCRIAAREYVFEPFTEVEIADFNDEQIQDFADKWFKAKDSDQLDAVGQSTIAQLFWQALEEQEPIKELAANPLLLTLLCLEFEESSEFPQSRAELYERGLNILLSKWDGQRRIKRDEVYKRLPIKRKEIMLGHLAMYTFERGEYFFRTHVAEKKIGQYIQNLPDASTDPDALLVDSYSVLKAIESQHGLLTERAADIYSFSHLTFHEYFTAKNILGTSDPDALKVALEQLAEHITEKRWHEVFLLVTEQMEDADYLLTVMLQRINSILIEDEALQRFLSWVSKKATSVDIPYKPAAIRAFYLDLALDLSLGLKLALAHAHDYELEFELELKLAHARARALDHALDLAHVLDHKLICDKDLDHALDRALDRALDHARALDRVLTHARALNHHVRARARALNLALTRAIALALNLNLQRTLQTLRAQLPPPRSQDTEDFKRWWETKGKVWIKELRAMIIKHRNIGHDWQFSPEQIKKLDRYYNANLLLAECLKRAYLPNEARQRIEDGMLLPMG